MTKVTKTMTQSNQLKMHRDQSSFLIAIFRNITGSL